MDDHFFVACCIPAHTLLCGEFSEGYAPTKWLILLHHPRTVHVDPLPSFAISKPEYTWILQPGFQQPQL